MLGALARSARSAAARGGARRCMSSEEVAPVRLRRSVLFMPASNERALAKIPVLDADGFVLDIEDAVAPELKPKAREMAVEAAAVNRAADPNMSKELVIRVNALDTEWFADDVRAVSHSKADAVLLPKVNSAEDVLELEDRLDFCGALAELRIWCMIETPLGVLNAEEIAAASPRVQALMVGTVDLANETHCLPNAPGRWNLIMALSKCVLAARAHHKTLLDGVYIDVADDAGFTAECRQGRELGFDGKSLIHPRTIDLCNAVFSPSASEVAHAHDVVQAHLDATSAGAGVTTLHGKLVEALHVRDALRVLAMDEQIRAKAK